ncbi:hypothetical protein BGZ70_010062 [Mortierella alpina]|uniref:Uncharacterized protein n=1 Tax=Mortierella alpina TaxID=64518 RepID=A0A9P6J030_MORAP|nr:hypothetical protein BGZ70_010062 [Mortierella alpina]
MPAAIAIPTLSVSVSSSSTPAAAVMGSGAESAAGSVAAANKLSGESRRTEDAARTRRKIGDLEISNTSLLQINQTLEATVRKQAAEIQELKQRIQSSSQFGSGFHLIPDNTTSQGKDVSSEIIPENTPRSKSVITQETAVIILELTEAERQADLTFKRLCATIEQMLYEARQALDQSTRPAGVKVLSSFDMHQKEPMDDDDLDLAHQSIIENDDADKSLDLSIAAVDDDDDQDLNDASTLGADSTLG